MHKAIFNALRGKFFKSMLILLTWGCSHVALSQVLVLVDGKWVVKQNYSGTESRSSPERKIEAPASAKPTSKTLDALSAAGALAKLSAYYQDVNRSQTARERALKEAREQLEKDPSKNYSAVPITAKTEVNQPDELWRSGPYSVKVRDYDLRAAGLSSDYYKLLKSVYREEAGLWPDVEPGFIAGAAIGIRLPDGSISSRMLDENDHKAYADQAAIRAKQAEEDYRKKLDQESTDAEKRKSLESEVERKKKEVEEANAQHERDKKKKESQEREDAIAKQKAERDRLNRERDSACRKGSGSADCIIADAKLTEWTEKAEKLHNTALCAMDAEKGPCAKDGPGCIYCQTIDSINKNTRLSNFNALQAKTRTKFLLSGQIPGPDFEKKVNAEVFSPSMIKQFRLQEFLP